MTNRTAQRKRQQAKGRSSKGRSSKGNRRNQRHRSRFPLFAIGAVAAIVVVMVGLSVYNHVRTPATPGEQRHGEGDRCGDNRSGRCARHGWSGQGGTTPRRRSPAERRRPRAARKPQVAYIGAEYCPFCASERWPMVIALSRLGTFSGLGLTTSSATDVFPEHPHAHVPRFDVRERRDLVHRRGNGNQSARCFGVRLRAARDAPPGGTAAAAADVRRATVHVAGRGASRSLL